MLHMCTGFWSANKAAAAVCQFIRIRNRLQVAFTNSPRDLIGAAAKSLGLPINFTARDMRACGVSESDFQGRLRAFRAQVRTYTRTNMLDSYKFQISLDRRDGPDESQTAALFS